MWTLGHLKQTQPDGGITNDAWDAYAERQADFVRENYVRPYPRGRADYWIGKDSDGQTIAQFHWYEASQELGPGVGYLSVKSSQSLFAGSGKSEAYRLAQRVAAELKLEFHPCSKRFYDLERLIADFEADEEHWAVVELTFRDDSEPCLAVLWFCAFEFHEEWIYYHMVDPITYKGQEGKCLAELARVERIRLVKMLDREK